MAGEVVKFGKYRGRPVADLLSDGPYVEWLQGQAWFRERYGDLLREITDREAHPTPEHNRLQALFLDMAYCRAFLLVSRAMGTARYPSDPPVLLADCPETPIRARFEGRFQAGRMPDHRGNAIDIMGSADVLIEAHAPHTHWTVPIEIKPVVGDDYPAVLRQMGRNHTRYLFVERYEGEGASRAQFVAIFAASGVGVVFKAEVDAALIAPA